MKNTFILVAVFFTVTVFAQTHELIKYDGKVLPINFIKIEGNLVYYSLKNQMEEMKISRYAVAELKEKTTNSSRIVSNLIKIDDSSEYRKVIILKESETVGLTKTEDLASPLAIAKGETRWSRFEMGEILLKQKAAKKGYPFIVITSNFPDQLKAIAYSY